MGKNKKSKKAKTINLPGAYVLHADRQKWVIADEAEANHANDTEGLRYGVDYLFGANGVVFVPA